MPVHRTRRRDGTARYLKRNEAKARAKLVYGPLRSKQNLTELEAALAKCLLHLGVSITVVADMLGTHHAYISAIKRGDLFQMTPALELWSRDVTGGLHKRIMQQDFATTWEDVYAVYNNLPSKGMMGEPNNEAKFQYRRDRNT